MDIGTNLIGMQDLEEFSEIQMDNGYWDIMERLWVSLAWKLKFGEYTQD